MTEAASDADGRLRLAMENSPIGLALASSEGAFLDVNDALCAFLGRDRASLLTATWQELTHPGDLDVDLGLAADVVQGRRDAYRLRKRFLRPDGQVVWGDLSVACVRDDERIFQYFISQIVDVSEQIAAQEALAESEARFRLLMENSIDVVFELSSDHHYVWVSPSVREMLGWAPEEIVGRDARPFVHPDDFPAISDAIDHPVEGRVAMDEFRHLRADGSYAWLSGRAREITDEHGRITGRVVALREIGELVRARTEIEVDRARMKAIIDAMLDPHVLLDAVRDAAGVVEDFVFADANLAALTVYDMSYEELIGSRLSALHPTARDTGLLDMYRAVVDEGRPLVLDDWSYAQEILGGVVRRYDVRAVRVGDSVSQNWRDVTERYESARAIADSESRYRLVAENSTDVIFLSDTSTRLNWVSSSSLQSLGWSPEELTGRMAIEFIHPDDVPALTYAVQRSAETGEPIRPRYRWRRPDGAYQWMEASGHPMDDASDPRGRVVSLRNIEAQVRAERELIASEETYRLLAENSSDVVLHLRRRLVMWVSPSLTEMLGWRPDTWIGRPFDEFVVEDDLARVRRALAAIESGESIVDRFRCRGRDGEFHWIELHARPYLDGEGLQDGVAASFRTVDEEVRVEAELERRAHFDDLTGLLNRKELFDRFGAILRFARRSGELPAVLFLDLDAFKEVNDGHGHSIGDALLLEVSRRVVDGVRASDLVARVGGDEVVVILAGVTGVEQAVAVAEKLRAAVGADVTVEGVTVRSTVSIGVTVAETGEPVDDVVARADMAMYEAKQAGRDCVRVRLRDGGPADD